MSVIIFVLLLVYYGGQSYMNFELICWGLILFGMLCYVIVPTKIVNRLEKRGHSNESKSYTPRCSV